jgi:hypothetical protein
MAGSRPTITNETRKCPFCKKKDIEIMVTSSYYSQQSTFAADRKKAMIPQFHPEKIKVIKTCPKCKRTEKEIKDNLEGRVSHKDFVKRMREQGLPTVITDEI